MIKRIVWITADYFIDVDCSLVPHLQQNYAKEYQIDWYVIKSISNNISIPNTPNKIFALKYRGKDPRIISEYKEIFTFINLQNSDLIYSDFLGVPYYFPYLLHYTKKKIPIIHAAHNVIPYKGWPSQKLMTWYVEFIFRNNKYFHLFSNHLLEYFENKYKNKHILISPMTTKGYGMERTNKYDIDKSKCNLLFFGNVKSNKRLDLLIDVIKSLSTEEQNRIHLTIAGSCDEPENYLKQIGDSNTISCYFHRIADNEVPELFLKHQYLVLPYENVAQSGPHMIAYHYNLPVIASDIAGMAEHIIDGETGFLFKVNDKESLKEVLKKVALSSLDRYWRIKSSLHAYVDNNHSLNVIAKKYIYYFKSILKS